MLENKDYCDYYTSITLGELGFPLKRMKVKNFIDGQFSESIVTVLLYEAQKWLREEKKIDVLIQLETKDIHLSSKYYSIYMSYMSRFRREFSYISQNFDSYEEALLEGIKTAIKILKEK